jgi:phenylacetic acid degradation operon negative regulatory protein
MSKSIDWWEVLDVLCWGLDKLARPTFSNLLAEYDEKRYREISPWVWRRMEQEQWVKRSGQGAQAEYTITEKGRKACAEQDPRAGWDRPWDGRWRLFTFDIPERRRLERQALWRELRGRRLGLLQLSVWIWPHDVQAILEEIIEVRGIPECFAGFECGRVFLCTSDEVAESAWDFDAIGNAQEAYLQQIVEITNGLRRTSDMAGLARWARAEREEYRNAFAQDPFLPKPLWPSGYRGPSVLAAHRDARAVLAHRLRRLV